MERKETEDIRRKCGKRTGGLETYNTHAEEEDESVGDVRKIDTDTGKQKLPRSPRVALYYTKLESAFVWSLRFMKLRSMCDLLSLTAARIHFHLLQTTSLGEFPEIRHNICMNFS
jgi:hypothetical protein